MDSRREVINKAKKLQKSGKHFRFFLIEGELWECYRAEYLPDTGERAWFAEKVSVYVIPPPSHTPPNP